MNKKPLEKLVGCAGKSGKVHRGRRRVTALDKEYAKALEGTLTEWLSKKDEKAYRKL